MKQKTELIAGLPADPDDPDDFDISEAEVQRALAARQARRGAQKAPVKVPVSIRLDADVVGTLRSGGTGWQSRANDLLRKGLGLETVSEPAGVQVMETDGTVRIEINPSAKSRSVREASSGRLVTTGRNKLTRPDKTRA